MTTLQGSVKATNGFNNNGTTFIINKPSAPLKPDSMKASPITQPSNGAVQQTQTNSEEDLKNERMRVNTIKELIESEEAYLSYLVSFIAYYVTPVKNGRFPELFSNPKADIKFIFSTLELIFEGNNELLEQLKKESDPSVGKIFLEQTEKIIQYYAVYCNHQNEAMETVDKCLKTSPAFKSFEDSAKAKFEVKGLGWADFLVKPFQRILKYPLFFAQLAKYTPSSHSDYANILKVQKVLDEEVAKINKNKAQTDDRKKMLELNASIEELPPKFKLLLPNRVCHYDGILQKISGSNDQERHFFLFNDCLIYAKKKGPKKYACRGVIYLNKLSVDEMPDSDVAFRIHRADKNLTYTLYGTSSKEKITWLQQIKAHLSKYGSSSKFPGASTSSTLTTSVSGPSALTTSSSFPVTTTTSVTSTFSDASNNKNTLKKEAVRVYVSKDTFKTLAISELTTAQDLCLETFRKVKMEGTKADLNTPDFTKEALNFRITLLINGKETFLQDHEQPLSFQRSLLKQGVKFGTDKNHFKLTSKTGSAYAVTAPTATSPLAATFTSTSSPPTLAETRRRSQSMGTLPTQPTFPKKLFSNPIPSTSTTTIATSAPLNTSNTIQAPAEVTTQPATTNTSTVSPPVPPSKVSLATKALISPPTSPRPGTRPLPILPPKPASLTSTTFVPSTTTPNPMASTYSPPSVKETTRSAYPSATVSSSRPSLFGGSKFNTLHTTWSQKN